MTDSPRIRRATSDAVAAISSCIAAVHAPYVARIGKPPAPMLDDYSDIVAAHDVFVLILDNKIIGTLVLLNRKQIYLLDNVAVHPDFQGRGFGRMLIAFAETRAKNAGFDFITLYTNEQMSENIQLYKKLGFMETERRTEQGYRRVYMRKIL